MTGSRVEKRGVLGAIAVSICALVACLAIAVAPAAAEEGNSAPIRPISAGGLRIPDIFGPEAPEEYPVQYSHLLNGVKFSQVDEQTIAVEYLGRSQPDATIKALPAYANDGAVVPTSIRLSEDEEGPIVTMIVRHRAGNPAAGGAPFLYPITGGPESKGGFFVGAVETTESAVEPTATPAASCKVPALHGLSVKAARARLRGAHCSLGQVHAPDGVTAAKGVVVKQFRGAGTKLAAGAPVAVKLGPRKAEAAGR
jgi:hypothetical protein